MTAAILPSAPVPAAQPHAGDQVTVGQETREVLVIKRDRVYYSWPGRLAVRSLPLGEWQRWARGPLG